MLEQVLCSRGSKLLIVTDYMVAEAVPRVTITLCPQHKQQTAQTGRHSVSKAWARISAPEFTAELPQAHTLISLIVLTQLPNQ